MAEILSSGIVAPTCQRTPSRHGGKLLEKSSGKQRRNKSLQQTPGMFYSTESWLAMQSNHDLWHAKRHVKLGKVGKVRLTAA